MMPALMPNDVVFGFKLAYGWRVPGSGSILFQWSEPKRGDVVILAGVESPLSIMVRRVVAVPGDSIMMDVRPGSAMLWNQGVSYPCVNIADDNQYCEERLDKKNILVRLPKNEKEARNMHNPVTLKENQYYLLADDRNDGPDSRDFGHIPLNMILGKVTHIWIPADEKLNFVKKRSYLHSVL